MASEYFKYLARNEKPDAPPPPMTRKEKLLNWLRYNIWWLIAGAVLLFIIGSILWNALGIGRTRPDYVFAYIGSAPIPKEQAEAFEKAMASLGKDGNGDGRVTVELKQYASGRGGDIETAIYYGYAADTRIIADITKGDSYFFLAEDPGAVQRAYQIFAKADGNAPDEDDLSVADKVFQWKNCPELSKLLSEDSAFSELFIGRRYFVGKAGGHEAEAELWEKITKGAER